MKAQTIDGRTIASSIKLKIRKEIVENNYTPNLAIILVGNDPASTLYVKLKEKACIEVGIDFHKYYLPDNTSQKEVEDIISFLNNDDNIDAILVQLPLPNHLNEKIIISKINKEKEVDGFGPGNMLDFMNNKANIIPGLSNGIYELIKSTGKSLENKKTLVIANSKIFATPIIKMMQYKKGVAKYISTKDKNLKLESKEADIIIIAIGKKFFLTKEMIKKGSIIIDVGINSIDGKIYGDVNPNVDEIAAYRSPVPGGVGPMTIAMLLLNTLQLHKLRN